MKQVLLAVGLTISLAGFFQTANGQGVQPELCLTSLDQLLGGDQTKYLKQPSTFSRVVVKADSLDPEVIVDSPVPIFVRIESINRNQKSYDVIAEFSSESPVPGVTSNQIRIQPGKSYIFHVRSLKVRNDCLNATACAGNVVLTTKGRVCLAWRALLLIINEPTLLNLKELKSQTITQAIPTAPGSLPFQPFIISDEPHLVEVTAPYSPTKYVLNFVVDYTDVDNTPKSVKFNSETMYVKGKSMSFRYVPSPTGDTAASFSFRVVQ